MEQRCSNPRIRFLSSTQRADQHWTDIHLNNLCRKRNGDSSVSHKDFTLSTTEFIAHSYHKPSLPPNLTLSLYLFLKSPPVCKKTSRSKISHHFICSVWAAYIKKVVDKHCLAFLGIFTVSHSRHRRQQTEFAQLPHTWTFQTLHVRTKTFTSKMWLRENRENAGVRLFA